MMISQLHMVLATIFGAIVVPLEPGLAQRTPSKDNSFFVLNLQWWLFAILQKKMDLNLKFMKKYNFYESKQKNWQLYVPTM